MKKNIFIKKIDNIDKPIPASTFTGTLYGNLQKRKLITTKVKIKRIVNKPTDIIIIYGDRHNPNLPKTKQILKEALWNKLNICNNFGLKSNKILQENKKPVYKLGQFN